MAIERARFLLKQDLMIKASQRASEAAELFRVGQGPEASNKLMEADEEFSKTKVVDTAFDVLFKQLQEGKIDDLPIEELQKLFAPQIEEKEQVVVEPQPVEEPAFVQLPEVKVPLRPGREPRLHAKERIIEKLEQASEQNPVPGSEIARPIWPDVNDPKKLRSRMFSYWDEVKKELAEEGQVIINTTTPAERTKGQEGRYYLAKKEVNPVVAVQEPVVVEKPAQKSVEVVQVDYKLTPEETYLLAYIVSQEENLKNLGISLHKNDQEEVWEILSKTVVGMSKVDRIEEVTQLAKLRLKLLAFAKDHNCVVEANQGRVAEYLLSFLSNVKSDQQVTELLAGVQIPTQ